MLRHARVISIYRSRAATVALWVALNAPFAWAAQGPLAQSSLTVIFLVVFLTPMYVWLVHKLDHRSHWLGILCLREAFRRGANKTAERRGDEFRRTLRLEMLTIMSGFAATLFVLSVQFYFDLEDARRPPFVLEAMAILFFLASILNLLQIVLYDFRLTAQGEGKVYRKMREHTDKKLKRFQDTAWHSLVAPMILAFFVIHPVLAVGMNCIYGLTLFFYYFLPCDQEILEYCKESHAH